MRLHKKDDDIDQRDVVFPANLHALYEAHGYSDDLEASAQDIVMLRVYVVNATMETFGQAIGPLRELVGDAMPSITTIGVQALYKSEFKVEIEMVVRLP